MLPYFTVILSTMELLQQGPKHSVDFQMCVLALEKLQLKSFNIFKVSLSTSVHHCRVTVASPVRGA